MKQKQEKQNRIVALLYSFGGHAVMLILAFFVISWKAPDPPLGMLGGNLALGFDTEGSGEQTSELVGSEKPAPAEETTPKPVEEQPEQKAQEEVKETAKVESEKVVTSNTDESEAVVKDVKKEDKKKEEEKKTEVKEQPKVTQPAVVYKNPTTKTEDKGGADKAGKPGNEGDDVGKNGDKGNPNGNEKGKALYGTAGDGTDGNGNGGSSMSMAGWEWEERPKPKNTKGESGRIVFNIKVDENGEFVSITKKEGGLSPEAEQACRVAIQNLSLIRKGNVPEISSGTITFVFSSK